MSFRRLADAPAAGHVALVRVDFNVPIQNGAISDDTRLRAALPTIQTLTQMGAKVALLAHFDRPKGKRVPEMSLSPVAPALAALLGAPVAFADDCVGDAAKAAIAAVPAGGVILLENTRFHAGEEANDASFAAEIAKLGDFYVNDAFSAAHRAHASTEGIAHVLPAFAGKAMEAELDALEAALGTPKRPVLGIVGGSKVSTKIDLLKNLVTRLDYLAIGGGMANTFLFAQGAEIGGSLCERDLAELAREIMAQAKESGCALLLPVDGLVAVEFKPHAAHRVSNLTDLTTDEKILDAGPQSVEKLKAAMAICQTLIWNGPLGVFEMPPFDFATNAAAHEAARLVKSGQLIAVAGGGDTVSAVNQAGVAQDLTFVSTAGGAFLEWMEGKPLPGVEALRV